MPACVCARRSVAVECACKARPVRVVGCKQNKLKHAVMTLLALQAGDFMAALAAGDWQVGSFMLGASVARCGYFEAC